MKERQKETEYLKKIQYRHYSYKIDVYMDEKISKN